MVGGKEKEGGGGNNTTSIPVGVPQAKPFFFSPPCYSLINPAADCDKRPVSPGQVFHLFPPSSSSCVLPLMRRDLEREFVDLGHQRPRHFLSGVTPRTLSVADRVKKIEKNEFTPASRSVGPAAFTPSRTENKRGNNAPWENRVFFGRWLLIKNDVISKSSTKGEPLSTSSRKPLGEANKSGFASPSDCCWRESGARCCRTLSIQLAPKRQNGKCLTIMKCNNSIGEPKVCPFQLTRFDIII